MGRDHQHAKLWITDGSMLGQVLWWGCQKEALPAGNFDLAFTPEVNDYNGWRSVQLKLLDWRPAA